MNMELELVMEKYYWINEKSVKFLERGYLAEGQTPQQRIKEIADNSIYNLPYVILTAREKIKDYTSHIEFLRVSKFNSDSSELTVNELKFAQYLALKKIKENTDVKKQDPELIVVVFLRYADAGKEAAPLAAQMISKWREIQKKQMVKAAQSIE